MFYGIFLFYAVYRFLKWKMLRSNGFRRIIFFIFLSPKFVGRVFTNFPVFHKLIVWVNEGFLSLHLADCVKNQKERNSQYCFFVKPILHPVNTLEQIPNKKQCQQLNISLFNTESLEIYMFKVYNEVTRTTRGKVNELGNVSLYNDVSTLLIRNYNTTYIKTMLLLRSIM